MPAKDELLRKDLILQTLASLRLRDEGAAKTLDALGDSLKADSIGQVVSVPHIAQSAQRAIQTHLGEDVAGTVRIHEDFLDELAADLTPV